MDKFDRLLDAMEHPDRYTPTEIEAMLQDPEVKETIALLDKTKSSLQTIITPDIEDEWRKFESNHHQSEKLKRPWYIRFFTKNAAASIAIGIASLSAVAAIVGAGIHRNNNNRSKTTPEVEMTTKANIVVVQSDTTVSFKPKEDAAPTIVVFDNETLEGIVTRISDYYEYQVIFNKDASKSLRLYFRWNQANTIEEVIERLNNFEQIHITINDRTIKID